MEGYQTEPSRDTTSWLLSVTVWSQTGHPESKKKQNWKVCKGNGHLCTNKSIELSSLSSHPPHTPHGDPTGTVKSLFTQIPYWAKHRGSSEQCGSAHLIWPRALTKHLPSLNNKSQGHFLHCSWHISPDLHLVFSKVIFILIWSLIPTVKRICPLW